MKSNMIGELNLILLNVPDNLTPIQKAYWIYNKAGHIFSYDYRVAEDISIADKEIDFENNSSDYYQTCIQMSNLMSLMFNNIEGLEARVIPRFIPTRGMHAKERDHVAVELHDKTTNKFYIVDLALDLFQIQSGMITEHFCRDKHAHSNGVKDDNDYSTLSVSDCIRLDKVTGINTTGKYMNDVIANAKKEILEIYKNDFDADIVKIGFEKVSEIMIGKSFRGHLEGKQFADRILSSIFSDIGINYDEFNLYYKESERIVTLFYIRQSSGERFVLYSNDNGLIVTSRDNIARMLRIGWTTRSDSLASLLEEQKRI
jgi:hypothetical protein